MSYCRDLFFMFNDLRCELVVCFVDIGGIVDNHCLIFVFITLIFRNDLLYFSLHIIMNVLRDHFLPWMVKKDKFMCNTEINVIVLIFY